MRAVSDGKLAACCPCCPCRLCLPHVSLCRLCLPARLVALPLARAQPLHLHVHGLVLRLELHGALEVRLGLERNGGTATATATGRAQDPVAATTALHRELEKHQGALANILEGRGGAAGTSSKQFLRMYAMARRTMVFTCGLRTKSIVWIHPKCPRNHVVLGMEMRNTTLFDSWKIAF